ncbi:MFS transporter [Halobacteriales archaeon QS_5_70_15]|nr:MAG: MFS transporter [Halobacteriales archaeon QS_5_70_15]
MSTGLRTAVGRLRGDGRGWALLAIAAGWLFILGGRFLVPAVLPQVKAAFDLGNADAGVAITVLWATYALMQSPAGLLVDRLGERRLLAGSLLLSAVVAAALGLAPTFPVFVLASAAFGFVTGLYGPARGTAISRTFPTNDGAALGAALAAGSVGSAVLPFLAGALVGNLGWRVVVGGMLVPYLAAATLAWWAVPPREGGASHEPTPPAELLGDVGRAIRNRAVLTAVGAVTLMLFAFQGLSAFLPTYLVEVKGFEQSTASALFALLFVGGALAQAVAGNLADAFGERAVLTGSAAVGGVTVAAVPFVDGVLPMAVLVTLVGSRLAVAPVSNAYVIAVLPAEVTGTAWGVIRTGFFLLGAGGSTVVGALAEAGLFDESFLLLAGLTGLAAALFAFVPSREVARAGGTRS